jgi:hypothetical protein
MAFEKVLHMRRTICILFEHGAGWPITYVYACWSFTPLASTALRKP